MSEDKKEAKENTVSYLPKYVCPYCDKEMLQHGACCGEVGHAKRVDEEKRQT